MNQDRGKLLRRPVAGRRMLLMLTMPALAVVIFVATLILGFGSRFHPYQAAIVHAPITVQPAKASRMPDKIELIHP